MITKDQLSAACRAHDNASDTGTSFEEILQRRGVNAKDAAYVAEQRALRMILAMRGQDAPMQFAAIRLTPDEEKLLMKLAAAWMDGLAVGLKVKP